MSNVRRVYVEKKGSYDVQQKALAHEIRNYLGIKDVEYVRILNRYDVENVSDETFERACNGIFAEPPVDVLWKEEAPVGSGDSLFSVEFLPGQFDQRADSAVQCVQFLDENAQPIIRSATTYVIEGTISDEEFDAIKHHCINPVDSRETGLEKPETLVTVFPEPEDVKIFDGFKEMPEAELKELYDSLNLAMTFKDFQHIQHYFKEEEKRDPSMTEIRVLDTYWSDHCRHTTFSTELTDVKFDEGDYKAPIVDTYKKYLADREELYKGRKDKFVCLMDLALMAMKKLKAWMAEHKKFSVIALCLLLMFTCGSAMSAINVSHHRAEAAKEQHAENNTDTTTAAEKKTKEETGKVELTDAQKEIIKGYDTDTKELIDTLSSSVWSVSEGRYTLKFADDSYVETVNGTPTVHSYAVSRVEKTSDGYGGYLYTIVFETDTGTHIVTYTDGSGAAVNSDSKTPGENTISTLTSSTMFAQKNTAYERAEAVANITVKGMNSEVTKLFGGDEKAVTTALSKWCAVHYPSVTEATWQKVVNLDYENGVITTDFKLNDSNSVSVTCVYEQSTGEFSFEG